MKAEKKGIAKKTILSLYDRIVLGTSLPEKGSYFSLTIIQDIRDKIHISQEEIKKYDLKSDGQHLSWNDKGTKAKFDISFTDLEIMEIIAGLKELNEKKQLTSVTLKLCKLFDFKPEK